MKERERNISVCLPLTLPQLGTQPATQACATSGNQLETFWLISQHPIHWATPARAAISVSSHLRSMRISFLIEVRAQKPVQLLKVQKQWTMIERWTTLHMSIRQTVVAANISASGGPLQQLCRHLPPLPQAMGIQAYTLSILPFSPREHTFKYMDRWVDITMQIVPFLLQNVPEISHFPKLSLRHFKYSKAGKTFQFLLNKDSTK